MIKYSFINIVITSLLSFIIYITIVALCCLMYPELHQGSISTSTVVQVTVEHTMSTCNICVLGQQLC